MTPTRCALWLSLVSLLSAACYHPCTPSTTLSCTCADGHMGTKICSSAGMYGICSCGGAGGGTAAGGGSAGGGGAAGGSAMGGGTSAGGGASNDAGLPDAGLPDAGHPMRVFITSDTFDGALGGLDALDSQCASSASAAGLGGNWVAWASDSNNDATDRVNDVGPWFLLDGTHVADNMGDLTSGLFAPIDRTELNTSSNDAVWTGTSPNAVVTMNTCSDWTSNLNSDLGTTGDSSSAGDGWTDAVEGDACDQKRALYCFEQ
jgi:hypothetical protein